MARSGRSVRTVIVLFCQSDFDGLGTASALYEEIGEEWFIKLLNRIRHGRLDARTISHS